MLTWAEFRRARPDLAEAGRQLLYQHGVGLAFLGTVRGDGGPRLHPMCPLATDDGLLAFIVPSPKRGDLRRDGRYTLHSFPSDDNEDAFSLSGRAVPVDDPGRRHAAKAQFLAERGGHDPGEQFDRQHLYEFTIDRCLWTVTAGHGDSSPRHTIWRLP